MSILPNFQNLSEKENSSEPSILYYKGENEITPNGIAPILWDRYGNKFLYIPPDVNTTNALGEALILKEVQPGLSNYNEILHRVYIPRYEKISK